MLNFLLKQISVSLKDEKLIIKTKRNAYFWVLSEVLINNKSAIKIDSYLDFDAHCKFDRFAQEALNILIVNELVVDDRI